MIMKKLIRIAKLQIVALSVLIATGASVQAASLGPYDVSLDLCKNTSLVTNVTNAWATANFPVVGTTPGFVTMLVETTAPLLELCQFIVQLNVSNKTDALFLTADKLNDITKKKWDDDLSLFKQTYKVANSVYDFNSGKNRKGTIDATTLAADLGKWQRMVTDLSNGNNPQAVKQRQEYDREIQELANVAHQRAILEEGTNCPAPPANAPNYNNIVNTEIRPRQTKVNQTDDDLRFLKSQLINIGPKILNGIDNVQQYYDDVQNMFALGVTYKVQESNRNVQTVKPTGKRNADGTAERQSQNMSQTIQTFSVMTNSEIFSQFMSKYGNAYSSWAKNFWEMNSSTEGGKRMLQHTFKPLAYECSETKLMRGYENLTGDEYEKKKDELFKQCQAANQMDERRVMGIMESYIQDLQTALYENKSAQAGIWSLESKYLGRQRSVSLDKSGNYYQESVVCEKTPEMVDLEMIQAKQQSVNAAYNQIIARETVKNAMMRDEEIRRQQQLADQQRMKRQEIEKDMMNEKNSISAPTATDLGGSF